jgi:hypothetical protein
MTKPAQPICAIISLDGIDSGTLQNIHIPRPVIPLHSKYPYEAALMENLQTVMLFLCGVPDFASIQ